MNPTRSVMRGALDRIGLANLLTLLDMERFSGLVLLSCGGRTGRLTLCDGRAVRAAIEGRRRPGMPGAGIEAIFQMLRWHEGQFEVWSASVDGADDQIGLATPHILMEAARRADEAAAASMVGDSASP